MLSIIVCSIYPDFYHECCKSISETISLPYELIKIDNAVEKISIAKAYNKGASQAKFPFLVFVHEDVKFETENWGQILINHLSNLENPGVVGIAASSYTSIFPHSWGNIIDKSKVFVHVLQSDKNKREANLIAVNSLYTKRVLLLDGVFMACRKEVWEAIKFDETIQGFHGYDYLFSINTSLKYNNYFIPDILITHYSEGTVDKNLFDTILICNRKIQSSLPLNIDNNYVIKKIEMDLFNSLIKNYWQYNNNICFIIRETHNYLMKGRNHLSLWRLYASFVKWNLICFINRKLK
jgi:hypothetical protein